MNRLACLAVAALAASLNLAACAQTPTSPLPPNNNPIQMNRDGPATRGPVRSGCGSRGRGGAMHPRGSRRTRVCGRWWSRRG